MIDWFFVYNFIFTPLNCVFTRNKVLKYLRERTRSLAYCDVAAARRRVILRDFTRSRSKTVHSFDVFLFLFCRCINRQLELSFKMFVCVKEFEARPTEAFA